MEGRYAQPRQDASVQGRARRVSRIPNLPPWSARSPCRAFFLKGVGLHPCHLAKTRARSELGQIEYVAARLPPPESPRPMHQRWTFPRLWAQLKVAVGSGAHELPLVLRSTLHGEPLRGRRPLLRTCPVHALALAMHSLAISHPIAASFAPPRLFPKFCWLRHVGLPCRSPSPGTAVGDSMPCTVRHGRCHPARSAISDAVRHLAA